MPTRRAFLATATIATIGMAWLNLPSAGSAESRPFDEGAFQAAIEAGKPVLVEISAPWCSVCRVQKKHLSDLLSDPKYAGIVALDVDFDSQGDIVSGFRAQRQSTLIMFAGGKEVARSVGDASRAGISAMLDLGT